MPKRGRAKDSATPAAVAPNDIKSAMEKSSKRALRLECEDISINTTEKSSNLALRLESEDNSTNDELDSSQEVVFADQENQISNNQLASMMSKLNERFADLEEKLVTSDNNAKVFNEKMSQWDSKVDNLSDTFTQLSNKVEDISSKTLTLGDSLTSAQDDLVKVLVTQEEFEEKYQEIIRLVASLQEKEVMIEAQQREIEELRDTQEYQQREIEELQDFKEKSLDKDEIREQYGRKMNLWLYGLDQKSKGENTWEVVKKFSVDVLGMNREILESWSVKNVHRVGDPTKPKRPVIIAFLRWEDRQAFLRRSSVLYQHNKDNGTSFSIKTDLAPRARQQRKDYFVITGLMKTQEDCQARVRDNHKGAVWIQKKMQNDHDWANLKTIDEKYLNQLKEIRAKEALEKSKQGVIRN